MIYVFKVKVRQDYTVEEYVEAWEQGSAVIQQMQGARGTRLHRGIGDSTTLLAIAEWDSKESRDRAMARLQRDPVSRETINRHLVYGDFSRIGEFEESGWSVVP